VDRPDPRKCNLSESRTREGVYGNPDVMAVFLRIELEGLATCSKAQPSDPCTGEPFFPCERCLVEDALDRPVDHRWPDDLAIAHALQIEAEFRDYEAVDRVNEILAADREERLLAPAERELPPAEKWRRSAERRDQLLPSAEMNDRTEIASVAFETLAALQWTSGFTATQAADLDALHRWHRVGGDPPALSKATTKQAKRRVARRRREAARTRPGEIRTSSTDRRRVLSLTPSFSTQLRRLRTEQDERELRSLVRQLRHQAKQRGRLPEDYDRRRVARLVAERP
jgi:hypothetical protein